MTKRIKKSVRERSTTSVEDRIRRGQPEKIPAPSTRGRAGITRFSRRETYPRQRWRSALQIALFLLWTFASIVISQTLLGLILFPILKDSLYTPLWITLYTASSYALSCLLVITVPKRLAKTKFANLILGPPKPSKKSKKQPPQKTSLRTLLGLSGSPRWRDIGLALAGLLIYFLLASLLIALFSLFPWFDPQQAQNTGFSNLPDLPSRIFAFIALVIVAPIAEELIFRGWLYAKLRSRASIWLSALLVSALFGLAHGAWNVGINVFVMSVVMCLIRELTGTIYGGIILHILKNALAFYLLIYSGIL